jgi:hypothetical protein
MLENRRERSSGKSVADPSRPAARSGTVDFTCGERSLRNLRSAARLGPPLAPAHGNPGPHPPPPPIFPFRPLITIRERSIAAPEAPCPEYQARAAGETPNRGASPCIPLRSYAVGRARSPQERRAAPGTAPGRGSDERRSWAALARQNRPEMEGPEPKARPAGTLGARRYSAAGVSGRARNRESVAAPGAAARSPARGPPQRGA